MVESDAFWGVPLPNRRSMSLRHAGSHAVGTPPIRLELLGGFELRAQGRSVRPPLQVQRLLAFLALQGGRPLHRAYVAGRLWIDLSQDHAHASLRTTLWRMRRAGCPVVDVTSTHVAIAPSVTVDVHELEACAGRVLQADAPATSQDLYLLAHAEELLPDWYQDWVLQDRERLHQLRVVALEAAAEALIVVRRYADAPPLRCLSDRSHGPVRPRSLSADAGARPGAPREVWLGRGRRRQVVPHRFQFG